MVLSARIIKCCAILHNFLISETDDEDRTFYPDEAMTTDESDNEEEEDIFEFELEMGPRNNSRINNRLHYLNTVFRGMNSIP